MPLRQKGLMHMQIFFFAVYLFEALIAFVYYYDNFKLKRSLPAAIAILSGLYLAAFAVNILDNNLNVVNDIAFFAANLIFGSVCFEISLKSSVFHSSFLLAVMFLTELVSEAGISALLKIPIDAYKSNFAALFIIGTISKILYLIVCKVVSTLFCLKNISENNRKRQFVLFLYPIIVTVTLTVFLYASTKYNFSKTLNFIFAIVSCASLVFCCFIFIYNNIIQKQEAELAILQAEQQRNEINKTFYELLEKKNEEQRILVHDMRHHFSAINSMSSTDEIKSYLSRVQSNLDEYRYIGKTSNKMFDLILSKYDFVCAQSGIAFDADVRESNLAFIIDDDLVAMLSNLLDNAVEAAKNSKNAYINLSVKNEKSFVVLRVVNSCAVAPEANGNLLKTTKNDASVHGYGTKSIRKTAKKYNGICEWHYDETEGSFSFTILFNKYN